MRWLKKIFCRRKQFKPQPKQLRIDGCKTVMTAAPDDSELAAQALLESRIYGDKDQRKDGRRKMEDGRSKHLASDVNHQTSGARDAEYYQQLSQKIRDSRAAERRLTMRYLSYCEEQLALPKELYVGQIGEMEQELYKRQDVAEREGGELLRRWQHCLAECIVRQMTAKTNTDLTDDADEHQPSDI